MDVYALVRRTVAAPLPGVVASDVRIPARRAACSVYLPEADAVAPEQFSDMLGVRAVRELTRENGWLLLSFTDAFYDACVLETVASLPLPDGDFGSQALNRMLVLARQAGRGCPRVETVQRALWLLLGAAYGYTPAHEAAQSFSRMLYPLPVRARMEARHLCGEMASACARLYYRAICAVPEV